MVTQADLRFISKLAQLSPERLRQVRRVMEALVRHQGEKELKEVFAFAMADRERQGDLFRTLQTWADGEGDFMETLRAWRAKYA